MALGYPRESLTERMLALKPDAAADRGVPLILLRALRTGLHAPELDRLNARSELGSWITKALEDPTSDEPTEYEATADAGLRSLISNGSTDPTRDEHVDMSLSSFDAITAVRTLETRAVDDSTRDEHSEVEALWANFGTLKTAAGSDPTMDEPTEACFD